MSNMAKILILRMIMSKKLSGTLLCGLFLAASANTQGANNAQLISAQYPAFMEAGKAYPVKLTFANTGSTAWTGGTVSNYTLYGVGEILNSGNWGVIRAYLPSGITVPPPNSSTGTSSYTFSFNVTAPSNTTGTASPTKFNWQMLQEGQEWFGPSTPVAPASQQVAVVYAPPLTTSTIATIGPTYIPKAPTRSDLTFAGFRGANVLQQTYVEAGRNHMKWFHEDADRDAMLDLAVKMKLNFVRIPVVIPPTTNYIASEWGNAATGRAALDTVLNKTRAFLTAASVRQLKVIVALDGYTKYGYSGEQKCFWKNSFKDVESNAELLVAGIKDQPALYAWDVLNEPLHNASQKWDAATKSCLESTAGQASPDAVKSVVNAVHAMYNLIGRYDRAHQTTVGEGNSAYLKYWRDISSFVSYHQYYTIDQDPAGDSNYALMKNLLIGTANTVSAENWSDLAPMPVVITEWGGIPSNATEARRVNYYKNYLQTLKGLNIGSAFWSISKANQFAISPGAPLTCLVAGIQSSDNPACPAPSTDAVSSNP
jgi:hypothetical protein